MTACQTMPVSPPETGFILTTGPDSSTSQLFSPRLPISVEIPKEGLCTTDVKFMLVGTVPSRARKDIEIIVPGFNFTEAIHVQIRKISVFRNYDES